MSKVECPRACKGAPNCDVCAGRGEVEAEYADILTWLPLEAPARAPETEDEPTNPGTPIAIAKRKSGERPALIPDDVPTTPTLGAARER